MIFALILKKFPFSRLQSFPYPVLKNFGHEKFCRAGNWVTEDFHYIFRNIHFLNLFSPSPSPELLGTIIFTS